MQHNDLQEESCQSETVLRLPRESFLCPNSEGKLDLLLGQLSCGLNPVGTEDRMIEAMKSAPTLEDIQHIKKCKRLLQDARTADLTVISYQPGLRYGNQTALPYVKPYLREFAKRHPNNTVVGLAGDEGFGANGIYEHRNNVTYIVTNGEVIVQDKLSLSSEDMEFHRSQGKTLNVFRPQSKPDAITWAVLNSHDYTHVDLIRTLLDERVELLVVVTFNNAWRLFHEYALADSHRLFCFVVVVNVAEFGGSGVFEPIRRIGRVKWSSLNANGQLFSTRGCAADLSVRLSLEFRKYRQLRRECKSLRFGPSEPEATVEQELILPPEHFLLTRSQGEAVPPFVQAVRDVPIRWAPGHRFRIALAQLNPLKGAAEYAYRLHDHRDFCAFRDLLFLHLETLSRTCDDMPKTCRGNRLDMLVLPEVYLPRVLTDQVMDWSKQTGAIIIAGVDYPGEEPADNANECMILLPDQAPQFYRKVTRSKLDAVSADHKERLPYRRGEQLMRFVDEAGAGFGVLICYDFSHFDLVHRLNLEDRSEPLELVVVVAHNPSSELYRSCAIADSHRFYQFLGICNVASYGGSGLFGPRRLAGDRQVFTDAGKGAVSVLLHDLDFDALRQARRHKLEAQDRFGSEGYQRLPGVFARRF